MDTPNQEPTLGRDRSLGDVLRDARQAKGLELSDIAEITHVRKEYLKALEADDYSALPEDIYTKNFVKLFAQTVGLQEGRVLDLYARARGRAPAQAASQSVSAKTALPESDAFDRVKPAGVSRAPVRMGAWLPTTVFIGIVVALALWGFSNFSSRSTRLVRPDPTTIEGTAEIGTEAGVESDASVEVAPETAVEAVAPLETPSEDDPRSGLYTLTLSTTPPGADVMIDGFPLPGTTPLSYDLSPGTSRTLLVTLANYDSYEEKIDVSSDLELSVVLTPVGQTPEAPVAEAAADIPAEAPAGEAVVVGDGAADGLSISITEPTWLEVYASTERGVGERLVYTTAQAGQTFAFDLPVFLHVGNAGGVTVAREGEAASAMGSSGEVISRAYTP